MSSRLASVKVNYRQNQHHSLDIDAKVPQWIADQMAIRYLELLDIQQRQRKAKVKL